MIHLCQVVYKASLLYLQPRQMRLEITDMKGEGSDDIDADEDDDVDGLFAPEFAGKFLQSNEYFLRGAKRLRGGGRRTVHFNHHHLFM